MKPRELLHKIDADEYWLSRVKTLAVDTCTDKDSYDTVQQNLDDIADIAREFANIYRSAVADRAARARSVMKALENLPSDLRDANEEAIKALETGLSHDLHF